MSRRVWLFSLLCVGFSLLPMTGQAQNAACLENKQEQLVAVQSEDWTRSLALANDSLDKCDDNDEFKASSLDDIAFALCQLHRYDDAIRAAQKCAALDPKRTGCLLWGGGALSELGKLEQARRMYERAIDICQNDGCVHHNATMGLARKCLAKLSLQESTQKLEQAGRTYERALETCSNARCRDDARKAWNKASEGADKEAEEANKAYEEAENASSDELSDTSRQPSKNDKASEEQRSGTGFIVSSQGHILTNNHVVAGCRMLSTQDGKVLRVLGRNPDADLALLQANFKPPAIAVFRSGLAPKLGDDVVAFGFPLPGLLSSEGNVSAGIISASTGIQNDVRFFQISAPVQPGNSGGPLFDISGHVIGVVVGKLDALTVAKAIGDVPQNVNFAVNLAEVRAFLDESGVQYRKEISQRPLSTSNIASTATKVTVAIECNR